MLRLFNPRFFNLNPWARSTSNPDDPAYDDDLEYDDILEPDLLDPENRHIKKATKHRIGNIVYFLLSGVVSYITIDELNDDNYYIMVDDTRTEYYTFYRDEIMTNREYEKFLEEGRVIFLDEKPALKDTIYFVEWGYVTDISIDINTNRTIYEVKVGSDLRYFYGNQLMTEDEYDDKFFQMPNPTTVGGSRRRNKSRSRRNKSRSRRHKKSTRRRHRKH